MECFWKDGTMHGTTSTLAIVSTQVLIVTNIHNPDSLIAPKSPLAYFATAIDSIRVPESIFGHSSFKIYAVFGEIY